MLGLDVDETDTNSIEADSTSPTKTDNCQIKRFYWSKEKAKINEKVQIVVEGNENCDNKKANIQIFQDISIWEDAPKESLTSTFSENKISLEWVVKGTTVTRFRFNGYYFKIILDKYESAESERLEIE